MLNISVVYNLIIVVLQRLNIIPVFTTSGVYYGYSGDRCFSFFNGPYEFAGYLMIISCYYSYLISNKDKRKINIILITITYILLLLTKSRISLIASLAINYLIFLRFNKNPAKLFFKTIFMCLLALIIVVIIPQTRNLLSRFTSVDFNEMILTAKIAWKTRYYDIFVSSRDYKYDTILKLYKGDMSWAIRSSKWAVLIEGFLKSPLIGQGQSFALEAADGDYVRLLSESGIIGTYLFLFLCVNVVKIFKNKDNAIYSLINYGMLSLLISAIFIDVFESSKVMMFYWFICGVAFKNLVLDYKSNRIEN